MIGNGVPYVPASHNPEKVTRFMKEGKIFEGCHTNGRNARNLQKATAAKRGGAPQCDLRARFVSRKWQILPQRWFLELPLFFSQFQGRGMLLTARLNRKRDVLYLLYSRCETAWISDGKMPGRSISRSRLHSLASFLLLPQQSLLYAGSH